MPKAKLLPRRLLMLLIGVLVTECGSQLCVALAILLVNWGVKNFFLLALHIDLLAFPWG